MTLWHDDLTGPAHCPAPALPPSPAAAINPGNSGGPVFNDAGEVVGLAFQALTSAENIGYVVPTEIMTHFFENVHSNGTFTGFPDLGLQTQRMESPALRWGRTAAASHRTLGCCDKSCEWCKCSHPFKTCKTQRALPPCRLPTCRAAYNLSDEEQGLLVRKVYPLGSCAGQVQEGDVLTRCTGGVAGVQGSRGL